MPSIPLTKKGNMQNVSADDVSNAVELLLANAIGDAGAVSPIHAGGAFAVDSWIKDQDWPLSRV